MVHLVDASLWLLFVTKLETAETMEGVALTMSAPYFYPTSRQSPAPWSGSFYVLAEASVLCDSGAHE